MDANDDHSMISPYSALFSPKTQLASNQHVARMLASNFDATAQKAECLPFICCLIRYTNSQLIYKICMHITTQVASSYCLVYIHTCSITAHVFIHIWFKQDSTAMVLCFHVFGSHLLYTMQVVLLMSHILFKAIMQYVIWSSHTCIYTHTVCINYYTNMDSTRSRRERRWWSKSNSSINILFLGFRQPMWRCLLDCFLGMKWQNFEWRSPLWRDPRWPCDK